MKHRSHLAVLLLTLAVASTVPAAPPVPRQFRQGDVWAVVGDSITHGRRYHSFIYLFYATRFPEQRFETVNCGISGDSAGGAVRRFEWDIAPHKPTVATIMLGMNDVGRGNYGVGKTGPEHVKRQQGSIDGHIANMRTLSEKLRAIGCDVIYLTPSIYDQTADLPRENNLGVNDALGTCGRRVATELAPRFAAGVADLHGPMTELNTKYQEKDRTKTLVGPDRVHPGDLGQFLMACWFLRAQQVPATVAEFAIDAEGKVLRAENCRLTDAHAQDGAVSFTCLENALPFPVPGAAREATELVPFADEMNRETLTVTGLPTGDYTVLIDDAAVCVATASGLADGLNLAGNDRTPMYRQAAKVADLNEQRHAIPARKLRTFAAQKHFMGRDKTVDTDNYDAMKTALEARVAELKAKGHSLYGYMRGQAAIYIEHKPHEQELLTDLERLTDELWAANRPVAHRFLIRPVTDADTAILSGRLIDDFTEFSGWTHTSWTDVADTVSCQDGVAVITMPRNAEKRDMLGYSKACSVTIEEDDQLHIRLRASKDAEFGVEVSLDGKLQRVLNYVKTSGDWQTLTCKLPGKRASHITLILAESRASILWTGDHATFELDTIWVE